MHYKNGREAKPGDVALNLETGKTGVIYKTVAGREQCSARIAPITANDDYVTIKKCLHLDDVAAATIPDSTVAPEPTAGTGENAASAKQS
jgi:hypothetical protein